MENFVERKLAVLSDIKSLTDAIDTEVDWFIASLEEEDKFKKNLYEAVHLSKRARVKKLARRYYEKYR